MRLPSGEHDAPCGCVVRCVTWRLCPLFMSRTQSCSCALSLSDEYARLRAVGRPRRIGVERRVVREVHRLAADAA